MLVLALQFSKGNGRGLEFKKMNRALRGQRERELHAVRRGSATQIGSTPSKPEEKTKLVEPAGQEERILRLTCHFD
jgi:hypothetical protein